MRHLTRAFAVGALRRGKAVEQFLGETTVQGVRGVRWVAVEPWSGGYRVSLHTVADPDDEHALDLANLLSLDPVDEEFVGEGRELGRAADAESAIDLAERLTDAVGGRWVNATLAGEEYAELVRARRSAAG
ncbi:hypothetical protein Val02_73330 [Virgisporangium aliadipatigenens]|uniref:Uncharacterized protein n=1 Tax=Virgisporangium aliadipatigenens TaxID=741659 RepID=A0A8J3YTP4_9ACTN|nr:hypothetical protein [Virgisporangium aliadipatigenens]GIJ50447.1 hypothetical protein Val02_73330 [Virgisporangium aliadipatigenens]